MTTRFQRLLTALFSAGLAALLGLSVTVHAASGGGVTVSGTDEDGGAVSFSSDDVIFTLESETAAPLLSGPTEMPALEGDEIFFHYFIMSRANGEDTYTLSSSSGTPDNVSAPGTVTFIGNEDTDGDGENDPITTVTLGEPLPVRVQVLEPATLQCRMTMIRTITSPTVLQTATRL